MTDRQNRQTEQYIGIDYGLGRSNVDKDNGIRYGVISMNSINLDCTDSFEYDYGEPTCPTCGEPVVESPHESVTDEDWNDGKDFACATCKACYWSDAVYSDEAIGWSYDADGYELTGCLDNDIFVLTSPYYTFAQFCSPCVPGAGNLDNPMSEGVKTYCLGADWFENERAPYPVYSVISGTARSRPH